MVVITFFIVTAALTAGAATALSIRVIADCALAAGILPIVACAATAAQIGRYKTPFIARAVYTHLTCGVTVADRRRWRWRRRWVITTAAATSVACFGNDKKYSQNRNDNR
jgi:hypothetical protein